jgi:hypothetical protein
VIERSEALKLMDQLEALVLKKGWPIPLTPFYLVDHEKMLVLLDQLRVSIQDEVDGRFIKAFANQQEANQTFYQQQPNKGKERSH